MRRMNLAAAEVIARAEQRGYTLAEIQPCILEKLPGDRWLVDVDSHFYPHPKDRRPPLMAAAPAPSGPGTEVKRILGWFGITTSSGCSCNKRAKQMDVWGAAKCLANHREIVGWFAEEARKRRLRYWTIMGYGLLVAAVCKSLFSGTRR